MPLERLKAGPGPGASTANQMHGWKLIMQRYERVYELLHVEYAVTSQTMLLMNINAALILLHEIGEIMVPAESRVGRMSISQRLKTLVITTKGLKHGLETRVMKSARVTEILAMLHKDLDDVYQGLLTKTDEATAIKTLVRANVRLSGSMNDVMARYKQIQSDRIASDAPKPEKLIETVEHLGSINEQLKAAASKFRADMQQPFKHVRWLRTSVAILPDPFIAYSKLQRVNVPFISLSPMLILQDQMVAAVKTSQINKDANIINSYLLKLALDRYKMPYTNLLHSSDPDAVAYLQDKTHPDIRFYWLMPRDVYFNIGSFRVVKAGFPWNADTVK